MPHVAVLSEDRRKGLMQLVVFLHEPLPRQTRRGHWMLEIEEAPVRAAVGLTLDDGVKGPERLGAGQRREDRKRGVIDPVVLDESRHAAEAALSEIGVHDKAGEQLDADFARNPDPCLDLRDLAFATELYRDLAVELLG